MTMGNSHFFCTMEPALIGYVTTSKFAVLIVVLRVNANDHIDLVYFNLRNYLSIHAALSNATPSRRMIDASKIGFA